MNIDSNGQRKFWTKEHSDFLAATHNLLSQAILKDFELRLFRDLKKCYLLEPETLQEFACGIQFEPYLEWLILPYKTGYNRITLFDETVINKGKETYANVEVVAQGSRPYSTFFGLDSLAGKETLYITESPFETMLMWQNMNKNNNGINGDVIGFIPDSKLLDKYLGKGQLDLLKDVLSNGYKNVYLIINESPSLVIKLSDYLYKHSLKDGFKMNLAAIDVLTKGKYKTYLDLMKEPRKIDFLAPIKNALELV